MTNKNKKVSFRISEEKFQSLQSEVELKETSLSELFRDYVDRFIDHDGRVAIKATHEIQTGDPDEFPPTVEVPTAMIREHERKELGVEHLREQLDEYKRHINQLQDEIDKRELGDQDVVRLEELDRLTSTTSSATSLD